MKRGLLVALLAAAFCAPAHAGGPAMLVGAAEDEVPKPTLVATKANMTLLRIAGFDSVRISALWGPGKVAPTAAERTLFANVQTAARLTGMRVFLAVYDAGSRFTPLTDTDRAQFAQFAASLAKAYPLFRDVIVGNEPNNNRFWLPQFGLDGSDVAAPAYMQLLAQTYDALKSVSPSLTVIGGALEPRGGDNPAATKPTHSPTQFLLDLGEAYRESGRTTPLMDELAIHPYQDTSSQPPAAAHPNTKTISISDYPKLLSILGQAFDGTAQPGSTLPLVYGEYGVEATIPAVKARFYTGKEPSTVHPVSEATQGQYYREAIGIAFCQPNVRAILLFHAFDEAALDRWQSGVYYTDRTPKSDLGVVRDAISQSHRGVVARCPGLQLPVKPAVTAPSAAALSRAAHASLAIRCDIDCAYVARLQRMPRGSTVQVVRGRATGGKSATIRFPHRVGPGRYRFSVQTVAAVNPGHAVTRVTKTFRISAAKR